MMGRTVLIALVSFCCAAMTAAAPLGDAALQPQAAVTGRLTGTITDPSGAALPGITLVITAPGLTVPRTVVTDRAGRFEVSGLPVGPVSVTCRAAGFVEWRRDGVDVAAGPPTTLNVVMRRPDRPTAAVPTPRPPVPADAAADPDDLPAAPPPPPGPPSADQLLDQIDRFLDQLPQGSIAFNAPDTMLADDTTEMRLVLSPVLSVAALEETLQGMPGIVQGAVIRISPRMEAVLTGQNFEIAAITPALQAIARNEPTEWRWQVTPRSAGAHRLHLVLNAQVDGTSRTLRTFDRTIQVDVTLGRQISGFVSEHWQWLWTTALVPLAGWAWRRRRTKPAAAERSTIEG